MVEPVKPEKKAYSSALRESQARATRRAIVAAAAELFVRDGYGATTVDAIAAAAGVSRKTVFTSVGGKAEALKLAIDWAIVGDDEPVPLMERASVAQQQAEPDARAVLRGFAAMVVEVAGRVAQLISVAAAAAGQDPDLRTLIEQNRTQRRFGMGMLAAELERRGALRADLSTDEAADVLWLFNDPLTYDRLVHQRGWTPERYEKWLADALISLLIDPKYRPPKRARSERAE